MRLPKKTRTPKKAAATGDNPNDISEKDAQAADTGASVPSAQPQNHDLDSRLGPATTVEHAQRSTKTFKFIEAAAAIIGLAGVVVGWNLNLRIVVPLAAVLLVGGLLLLILDWAGLISRRFRAAFVTTVIGCYILFLIIVGACSVTSAIWNKPWPLLQLITNFMLPSQPPATAARKPACQLAKEVLAKLDSVSLPTDANHQHALESAFGILSQIWQLDSEYNSKTSWRTGKSVLLNATELDNNRKQRAQMLGQFRSSAKPLIDDWKAIVEALSKTASAVKTIKNIDGMNAFAENLNYSMQYWMEVRADLSDAIAIAEGDRDVILSIDPQSQTPLNIGFRLLGGFPSRSSLAGTSLADAFRRLRIAWGQIEAGSCE